MRGFIAPGKYLQGEDALKQLCSLVKEYSEKVPILIDGFLYAKLEGNLRRQFKNEGIYAEMLRFGGEVTTKEIHKLDEIVEERQTGTILRIEALGTQIKGWKVLWTCKRPDHKRKCTGNECIFLSGKMDGHL